MAKKKPNWSGKFFVEWKKFQQANPQATTEDRKAMILSVSQGRTDSHMELRWNEFEELLRALQGGHNESKDAQLARLLETARKNPRIHDPEAYLLGAARRSLRLPDLASLEEIPSYRLQDLYPALR
jgi:hypothetical protein